MPCLRSIPLPSCSFHADGCAHEGSRQGALSNIVSMAGLVATAKSSLYSATKFACGFSDALRQNSAFGVHVTTIRPHSDHFSFDQSRPRRKLCQSCGSPHGTGLCERS